MALPAPNLDDRRFQDLVDDAKRLVQRRCPGWTDHNVSDPGVTLIETFAFMVDQLLYRVNRVPDRLYVKFLDLIGLKLFPPTAARVPVTFWLTAPQPETVVVPAGTEVATLRTEVDDAVTFQTVAPLAIVPCSRLRAVTHAEGGQPLDTTTPLDARQGFAAFAPQPQPGDALLVGLSDPVPSCAVALRFDCRIEGVGVDPLRPPVVWEAWTADGWATCEVDRDETGGLNRAGDIVLHVPAGHEASVVLGQRAGWLRCRVVAPFAGQPFYSSSPRIVSLGAFTIGGTTLAVHAEEIRDEIVGLTEGTPGQRFLLRHAPVVPSGEPPVVEIAAGDGWQRWDVVESFAHSGPGDRHVTLDAAAGELRLPPAVREADGRLRSYGAVPPKGAAVRVRSYRTGGGSIGNVARHTVTVLKTSLPLVGSVDNRRAASGGVDAETVDEARERGPLLLRTRDRAVTAEDYELLAREAAPEVARTRCVPAGDSGDPGGVRVLIVPAVAAAAGTLRFEQLVPGDATLQRVAAYLDERRAVGARITVEPPLYQGVTVVARLRARPTTAPTRLRDDALDALFGYLDPLVGGPDGEGWPFGRPVHVGEVYAVLQRVEGIEFVEDARLFAADPVTGQRGEQVTRIDLAPHALVFSYGHQVLVEGA